MLTNCCYSILDYAHISTHNAAALERVNIDPLWVRQTWAPGPPTLQHKSFLSPRDASWHFVLQINPRTFFFLFQALHKVCTYIVQKSCWIQWLDPDAALNPRIIPPRSLSLYNPRHREKTFQNMYLCRPDQCTGGAWDTMGVEWKIFCSGRYFLGLLWALGDDIVLRIRCQRIEWERGIFLWRGPFLGICRIVVSFFC